MSSPQVEKAIQQILDKLNASIAVTGSIIADTELPAAALLDDGLTAQTTQRFASLLMGFTGTVYNRLYTASAIADADTGVTSLPFAETIFNGTTWERKRTSKVFKSLNAVVITSETAVWTPAAGKRFRLMGYALTTGVLTGAITIRDNTAGATILIIPQNTIGVQMISPPMGNGILSGAINQPLTMQGATAETVTGFLFGTEE